MEIEIFVVFDCLKNKKGIWKFEGTWKFEGIWKLDFEGLGNFGLGRSLELENSDLDFDDCKFWIFGFWEKLEFCK